MFLHSCFCWGAILLTANEVVRELRGPSGCLAVLWLLWGPRLWQDKSKSASASKIRRREAGLDKSIIGLIKSFPYETRRYSLLRSVVQSATCVACHETRKAKVRKGCRPFCISADVMICLLSSVRTKSEEEWMLDPVYIADEYKLTKNGEKVRAPTCKYLVTPEYRS